ncbi:MAG: universal stress protein [Gammaproteobacteria bacterium]|nr:universal stress protein [Gammaproteobacteria bacterium]
MSAYQHILVALDTGNEATQVLSKAITLATCFDSKITLIHVVEPVIVENSYDMITSLPLELESTLVEHAEKFLASCAESLSLDAEKMVTTGSIKGEILSFAKSAGVDLIVAGSHGRHGLGLLLGSTANALLHGCECDAHIVRIIKTK